MSNSPKQKAKLQDITTSITSDELIAYLQKTIEKQGDDNDTFECHYCKSQKWQVRSYPGDSNRPLLLAHPIPQKSLSSWYFPVSCRDCGYTMFFDAQHITIAIDKLRNEDDSDV